VAFDFRGGRVDPQVLERQIEGRAIVEGDGQHPRAALKLNFGRYGIRHGRRSIAARIALCSAQKLHQNDDISQRNTILTAIAPKWSRTTAAAANAPY
jgi:hypothetical protein